MKKSFKLRILFHLLFLLITVFLLAYLFLNSYYISSLFVVGLLAIQLALLFKLIDRVNRQLTLFVNSLAFGDFNWNFGGNTVPLFSELDLAVRQAGERFHKIVSEKEQKLQYLEAILKNVDIGIMAFDSSGNIHMANRAAAKFFSKNNLRHLTELDEVNSSVSKDLLTLKPGNTLMLTLKDDDDLLHLNVSGIEFRMNDNSFMLISIKNIYAVLEEKETEAWQKLIGVLTHEIMNSITPIASLADMVSQTISRNKQDNCISLDNETIVETEQALDTINRRSSGLLNFVEKYRSLTRVPFPDFKQVNVNTFLTGILSLFDEKFKKRNITVNTTIPDNVKLFIDPNMIEQVLINILKNAAEALSSRENPVIDIKFYYNNRNHPCIEVADNGQGILPEVIDKIFVPFFTTKSKGSGIGLSLSRQIMHKHQGKIFVRSQYAKGSIFTLQF